MYTRVRMVCTKRTRRTYSHAYDDTTGRRADGGRGTGLVAINRPPPPLPQPRTTGRRVRGGFSAAATPLFRRRGAGGHIISCAAIYGSQAAVRRRESTAAAFIGRAIRTIVSVTGTAAAARQIARRALPRFNSTPPTTFVASASHG